MLLKFALQEFIEDREFQNLSETTLTSYKDTFKQFEEFCTSKEIVNVNDVTTNTIKSYINHCRKLGNNTTSTNSKLRRLKALFNHLVNEEVIKTNPASKLSSSKEDIKIEVFSDNQVKQMLNYYRRIKKREKSFFAYRDYTIIVVLLSTGLRQTELTHLKWANIDFNYYTLKVFGKSRKIETIPLTEKLVKELASYKVYCEQTFGKDNLNDYVFTNRQNKPLSANAVQNVFKRLSKIMNFKDVRLSSHTFRHTFCQRCIQSGMSTFAVQKLMRHSSISTTERYAAMWGNDLAEQNDKYNPLNNLEV
ncbi:tyrosine recombinase XerC [Lentibacillus halophilus]|uniref:Tyrosine recombinase XerC n=1 Tax=Lentibacillus halophilus TaxID=295065 RepID=A0ABN0Z546_9BACI